MNLNLKELEQFYGICNLNPETIAHSPVVQLPVQSSPVSSGDYTSTNSFDQLSSIPI